MEWFPVGHTRLLRILNALYTNFANPQICLLLAELINSISLNMDGLVRKYLGTSVFLSSS